MINKTVFISISYSEFNRKSSLTLAVVSILTSISVANRFGKGGGFAAGMIFLPIIFYPILGFGSATYQPQVAAA